MGFRVWGLGFGVQGLGFRVQGLGSRVCGVWGKVSRSRGCGDFEVSGFEILRV